MHLFSCKDDERNHISVNLEEFVLAKELPNHVQVKFRGGVFVRVLKDTWREMWGVLNRLTRVSSPLVMSELGEGPWPSPGPVGDAAPPAVGLRPEGAAQELPEGF